MLLLLLADGALCAQTLPAIDRYHVSVRPLSAGSVEVRGNLGTVDANSTVTVNNVSTGNQVQVAEAGNGSFVASLAATPGQHLRISAQGLTAGPTTPLEIVVATVTIKNPFTATGYWYVGQGHAHSTASDGVDPPAAVEAAYYDRGYNFVISTDHYGFPGRFVDFDDGMTPDPDNASTGKDLLWIASSEVSNNHAHMGAWGTQSQLPLTEIEEIQGAIDAARARGGIAVINHPALGSDYYDWDWDREIVPNRRYSLIEAFNNGHLVLPDYRTHLAVAVDLADASQQVWWIGTDDCHNVNDPAKFDHYAMVVQTDSPTVNANDVIAAADAGRVYIRESAAGPAINSVQVSGNTVAVTLPDIASNYNVMWKKRGDALLRRDSAVNTSDSYTLNGSEGYVRAEIERISDGKRAYTQPLFVAGTTDLAVSASSTALVDNDSATVWDSGAASGSFIVDAGKLGALNAIHIDWDGADGRRFNYRIETSDTGAFTGEQQEVVRPTYLNRQAETVDFFDEWTRYVRVVITGQSMGAPASARVREVELFVSAPARTDFYVDNVNGNDANSGLTGSPWRTVSHALPRLRPRDTLNLVATAQPFGAPIELGSVQSGKHPSATVELRGDPVLRTQVDATAASFGVRLIDTQFVTVSQLLVHSATDYGIWLAGVRQGTTLTGNVIRNNLQRGILGSGTFDVTYNLIDHNATEGVFAYIDGTNARVFNNVIYGNGGAGLILNGVSGTVQNNVISGNTGPALARDSGGLVTDSHNCVFGAWSGPWLKTSTVKSNPRLTNPEAGDFHLNTNSPCIDAGVDLALASDFDGNPIFDEPGVPNTGSPGANSRNYVDIGAYETVAPCSNCPSCH